MISFRLQRKAQGLQRFAVALLLSAVSVSALAGDISVSARDVNEALWRGDHMEVKYSAQAKFAANDPRYKVIPIKYKASDIFKRAVRNVKKNPGAAAVSAAIVAVAASSEWVIDELTGQITGPPVSTGAFGEWEEGYFWCTGSCSQEQKYPSIDSYLATLNSDLSFRCDPTGPTSCKVQYYYAAGDKWNSITNAYRSECTSSDYGFSYCQTPSGGPVSEENLAAALNSVLSRMSPSELRDFFKNGGYLPELTPELNAALQEWANDIASETGLDPAEAAEEATSKDSPTDVQDVRVVDPVAIDGSDVPTEIPESIWKYTGDIFEKRKEEIDDITGDSFGVPTLDFTPELPQYSACQSIPIRFMGASVDFPGPSGCRALDKLKDIFGYLLYITTGWVILQIATKPRSV